MALPLGRYWPPIPRNDDHIHRYILPRTTTFPQDPPSSYVCNSQETLGPDISWMSYLDGPQVNVSEKGT